MKMRIVLVMWRGDWNFFRLSYARTLALLFFANISNVLKIISLFRCKICSNFLVSKKRKPTQLNSANYCGGSCNIKFRKIVNFKLRHWNLLLSLGFPASPYLLYLSPRPLSEERLQYWWNTRWRCKIAQYLHDDVVSQPVCRLKSQKILWIEGERPH